MPTLRQNSPQQFQAQLLQGHYNELRVALFFMLRGNFARVGFDGASFDVSYISPRAPDKVSKVEVKWDKKAGESGRLYFEFLNTRKKKPSGVAATDADWWCQVVGSGEKALLMPVAWLRVWLERGDFRQVGTRGVDANSKGYLVPLEALLAESRVKRIALPTLDDYFGLLVQQALGIAAPSLPGHAEEKGSHCP